jgi:hypothetical protein
MSCKFFNFSSNRHLSGYVISGCSLKIEGRVNYPQRGSRNLEEVNGPILSSHKARGQGRGTPALGCGECEQEGAAAG